MDNTKPKEGVKAPSLDTLVEDIYGLFTSDFKPSDESVSAFASALSKKISERIGEERGVPQLRLSNLGTRCQRQLWYRINTPDLGEQLPPEARFKFLFGDILEELILFLAREAGHKVEREQEEVNLYGVKGHIDAVVDDVLVDVKSASTFSFKKFKDGLNRESDSFGYLDQLGGYSDATSISSTAFIAVDKTLGHICVDKHTKPKVDYKSKVEQTQKMLSLPEPPKRGFSPEPDGKSGNMKLGVNCSYCEFKKNCYPGLRTFIYSTGPRYLTRVVREPDVKEINPFDV